MIRGKAEQFFQTFIQSMQCQLILHNQEKIFRCHCFRKRRQILEVVIKCITIDPAFQYNILYRDPA